MNEKDDNTANKSDTALREEAVLRFWKENKIFEKSLEQTKGKKEFVFYEGPPTANGAPGIHHLEARAFKDAIPRYKTMQGFHVRRKGGWDTHGLPVELQVEKKLGLDSKKAIEEYGIAKFNQECKKSVWEYLDVWNKFTKRIGYWVDQENPYVTYDNNYIESVWNIVKKINDQKLLYKDYKVVPWCPRCGTALSSHELAQGYEDVKDLSVYVKFRIRSAGAEKFSQSSGRSQNYSAENLAQPDIRKSFSSSACFLAWTTTPWTLPGNVALAVGKDIDYVEIKVKDEILVLAKERLSVITDPYEIIAEHKGSEMVGMQYEPLFPFLSENISSEEKLKLDKAFKVYVADFVNTIDGTGIVHTAVMYGQDDFELGTKVGLPKHHLVGLEGKFLSGTGFLAGRFVKETDQNGKPTLAVDIIKYLTEKNLFFKKENYEHSYPHCWRCHTALIYYARDSWYIKMSDPNIKSKMISENKKINWEPEYIKEGRFGEWLEGVKDWAISRERYWGTPLPVWICESCKKIEVIGSVDDLKAKTQKSGNRYFVMRHGEAENNVLGVASHNKNFQHHLTEKGKKQIQDGLKKIKNIKFDFIYASPLSRTQETAEIIKDELKVNLPVVTDDRLVEFNPGEFDGKSVNAWNAFFPNRTEEFIMRPKNGENLNDVRRRIADFLRELESKHQDKTILIISHLDPIWMMYANNLGMTAKQALESYENYAFKNGEVKKLDFMTLPCNENQELDLHKPYVDKVSLVCGCGGNLTRVKEVLDVWFDSGAMPFAQDHYPFENKKWVENNGYPADYISEAIDQTRGWFYTLHAIGTLMSRGLAYKNVICLGHLLDATGKKMSKSLGNVVDPWIMMDKYGADTLRLWMYSVNQPGESKNFDETTVALLHQQIFGLLYNVLAFYELYRDRKVEKNARPRSKNILDMWILARLDTLIKSNTDNLEKYKLLEPVRGMRDFIGDLSTWYLRRSRERIKSTSGQASGETKDGDNAKATLYFILKTLAKIMAPFAPFTSEDIWLKLKNEEDAMSVHLAEWPKMSKNLFDIFGRGEAKVLENMRIVREIVSLGLEARQREKIPVRQPLSKIEIKDYKLGTEYIELIKEELNLKEVIVAQNIDNQVLLFTQITPALKAEGEYREFMRELQDERKKAGLNPGDKMPLSIYKIYKKYKIMPLLEKHMLRVAAVASLICDNFNEPLPKNDIITACLLHDMGNIIKADLNQFQEFNEKEELTYWQSVKDEYIKRYGTDEEEAHEKIMRELGVSEKIISIVNKINFSSLCDFRAGDDFIAKIINYADGRVSPYGIVSYEERMEEARKRYQNKSRANNFSEEERKKIIVCGKDIEKQIFAKCKIRPEDINDEAVAPIISSLKNYII